MLKYIYMQVSLFLLAEFYQELLAYNLKKKSMYIRDRK